MKKILLYNLAFLLFTGLACRLPFGSGVEASLSPELPGAADGSANAETVMAAGDLSGAQRQVLAVRGVPNRFMVRFSGAMREETWYYDPVGYEVTFRNGDTYTENQGDPIPAALVLQSVYTPWQFYGQMGLDDLLSISQAEVYAFENLEAVFDEQVSLITLPGLNAGFRGEKLLFIRAVPMASAQFATAGQVQGMDEQEAAAINLTAAEQAHVGTHTYDTYCTYSDDSSDAYTEPITWFFGEDGVYFEGEGPYPRLNENLYGIIDDENELYIHFQDNVITITGEFIQSGAEGEQVVVTFVCAVTQE